MDQNSNSPLAYAFGPFLLVPRERRLSRGEEVIDLAPKVFDALLLLLEHAGQLVTKDEFLGQLWPTTVVSESNLNKIIWQIRKALADEGETYIQTAPKLGYRFSAAVQTRHIAPDALPQPAADQREPIAATLQPPQCPRTPDDAPGVDRAPTSAARRRVALGAIALLALLISVGGFFSLRHRQGELPSEGHRGASGPLALESSTSLIVLPLNTASDADKHLADELQEELIDTLAPIEGLHIIARTSSTQVSSERGDLAAFARQFGIRYALSGSLRRESQLLRTSLRLTQIDTGEILWSAAIDRSDSQVLDLKREVAQAVGSTLAVKLSPQVQAAMNQHEDPLLYRRYLEARRWLRGDVVEWRKSIAAFRALVADAPGYARAHAGLAIALTQPSYADAAEAETMRISALAEADIALKLDPTLADAYIALADAKCRNAEWEACMTLTRHAVELAPADTTVRAWYARRLTTLGYLQAALEQMQIAYSIDPLSAEIHFMLGHTLDTLGRHDEAARYYSAVTPKRQTALWFNAVWRGDLNQARALIPDSKPWRDSYAAVVDALENPALWPQARMAIAASESESEGHSNWARVLDPTPDIAGDIAMLEGIWRKGASSMHSMLWNPQLANHRRAPEFAAYLRRTRIVDYWQAHQWPDLCRASLQEVVCH